MDSTNNLAEPAKLLLLASILAKDRAISNNGKAFLKELILRRDPRLIKLLKKFETTESHNAEFLEQIHNLIREEANALYNELFVDTSLEVGKTLSKNERDKKNINDVKSLIYGEVEFPSFYNVLRKINSKPGLIFYDLGSGTGKAVFVARFTQDFARCVGIEILQNLNNQARVIVDRYNSKFRQYMCSSQNQHATVFAGSFLDYDWTDGDVIFANSTCYDETLMSQLAEMAKRLKPGSIFVTFTKGLNSNAFELLEKKRYKMSWGPATVFIHRRLNPDGSNVGPVQFNLLPSDEIEFEIDDFPTNDDIDEDEDEDDEVDEDEDDDEEEEDDEDDDDDDDYDDDYDYDDDDDDDDNYAMYYESEDVREAMRKYRQHENNKYPGVSLINPMENEKSTVEPLNSPQDSALLKRRHQLAQTRQDYKN